MLTKVLTALRDETLTQRGITANLDFPPAELEQLIFGLTMTSLDGGIKGASPQTGSVADLKLVR